MGRGRVPIWVWMVLGLAHALALAWALKSGHWNFPDSGRYQQAASNWVQYGQLYAREWPATMPRGQAVQEFSIRPPGYPAMLAILGSVAGTWLLLLVQNGFSLLALGAVLREWGRRAQPTSRQWAVAVTLVLTFPAQLIYANAMMSEATLQVVLLGGVAALLAFWSTGRRWYWLGAAVAVAAALLLKPVCSLLAGGFALAGLAIGWCRRQAAVALLGLLPGMVAGAYMLWNLQRTGYFHFSSIAEINMLHYNAAGVVRQVEGAAAEDAWVAGVLRAANAQPGFAARQQLIRAEAQAVLRAHPWVYARQHLLGMGTFFLDPGRFDVSEFLGLPPLAGGGLLAQVRAGGLWRAIGQLPWGLLAGLLAILLANIARLVLAVRGFRRLGRGTGAEQAGRWLAAGLLMYLAVMTGPLGAARFLMPAWPLLLALALEGLRASAMTTEPAAASA